MIAEDMIGCLDSLELKALPKVPRDFRQGPLCRGSNPSRHDGHGHFPRGFPFVPTPRWLFLSLAMGCLGCGGDSPDVDLRERRRYGPGNSLIAHPPL